MLLSTPSWNLLEQSQVLGTEAHGTHVLGPASRFPSRVEPQQQQQQQAPGGGGGRAGVLAHASGHVCLGAITVIPSSPPQIGPLPMVTELGAVDMWGT